MFLEHQITNVRMISKGSCDTERLAAVVLLNILNLSFSIIDCCGCQTISIQLYWFLAV